MTSLVMMATLLRGMGKTFVCTRLQREYVPVVRQLSGVLERQFGGIQALVGQVGLADGVECFAFPDEERPFPGERQGRTAILQGWSEVTDCAQRDAQPGLSSRDYARVASFQTGKQCLLEAVGCLTEAFHLDVQESQVDHDVADGSALVGFS
jgi:hypothetical protein